MKKLKETVLTKIEIKKDDLKNHLENKLKIDSIEINQFLNTISDQNAILGYELPGFKTNKEESKRIVFLEISIINEKAITNLLNTIYKIFKQHAMIILMNQNEVKHWIAFNRNSLISDKAKSTIPRKFFITKVIKSKKFLKKILNWEQINLTSIDETFDQIARIIYYFDLQSDQKEIKPFKKVYDWEYFSMIFERNKCEALKTKLLKDKKKNGTNNEKRELSQQLNDIENKLRELNILINNKENMF